MPEEIKFGTDGWRGKIADNFTFKNVSTVAQAIADYVNEINTAKKKIVIGYDTRFLSKEFAKAVAEILAANYIGVLFSKDVISSPGVSKAVKDHNLIGGVMITASHNPAEYNGIKFKAEYGGSAEASVTRRMEELLSQTSIKRVPFEQAVKNDIIQIIDLYQEYLNGIKQYIDLDILNKANMTIVVDSMYGAGKTMIEEILENSLCDITTIHKIPNPSFPNIHPEPIPPHTNELAQTVIEKKASLGIVTDGDADRIGAVDENGNFVNPHQILCLLLIHLYENRHLQGKVVRTISSSYMVNKIAKNFGLDITETPIGFKYICKLMREENILIGGEESGGIGLKNYIPERDGILCGLLLIELLAIKKKTLGEMVTYLDKTFGQLRYSRIDKHFENEKKIKALSTLKENPCTSVLGKQVIDVKTYDGVKLIFEDHTWLLFRASGTEPLLRIYSEQHSKEEVKEFLEEGQRIAEERGA